jgi:hypothetical protein
MMSEFDRHNVYSSYIPFQQAIVHLTRDHMQKLRPREVVVPTYPIGAHMTFGTSSPHWGHKPFLFSSSGGYRFLDI